MRPSDLDPERWRLIDRVLERALETPTSERAEYLDETCGGDPELRTLVEELLEAHAVGDRRLGESAAALGAVLFSSSLTGGRIGPYRVVREIGRGGMGVVYLAEDPRLGRRVALKVLPPHLGGGTRAQRRFLAEARAVSTLDHPNVATLHGIDVTRDGQLYMVFSFYEGETLEERIRRGPFTPDSAIGVASSIASGLAAAHDRGIIHRDVKPSNVLLTRDGGVKLLDFGVAKVLGEDLTGDGAAPGTVAYMSPEQAAGEAVDPRTDLWSLGVVLYEMLTSTRPFKGSDPASTLRSIIEDRPGAPSELTEGLPPGLEHILEGLLAKEPAVRYSSARALLDDLSRVGEGRLPKGAATGESRWLAGRGKGESGGLPGARWRVSTGVVAAVAAVVALASWLVRDGSSPQASDVHALAVLPLENVSGDPTRQHVVEGIHDALVERLGAAGVVDVVSATPAEAMGTAGLSLPETARRLGVDAVVEGSVLSDGDSLTVTVQVTRASSEDPFWGDVYRSDLGAAPALAERISSAVTAAVGIPAGPATDSPAAADTRVDPRAYDAYLQARFNLSRGSAEGFALAERYLGQALRFDSSFVPAYVDLAEARGRAAFFGLRDPREVLPGVASLIDKALSMDTANASAYATHASLRLFWARDWVGAERSARRVVELNPSLPAGHYTLSEVMAVRGEYDQALALAERGSALAPWTQFSSVRPALALYYMRDFDDAIDRIQEAIDFFPEFWQGHWILCMSLAGAGRLPEAVEECNEAVVLSRRASMALGGLAYVQALAGDSTAARSILRELESPPEGAYVAPTDVAMVYAGLGDRDGAFEWLERALEERDMMLMHVQDQAFFDPLRVDPRFDHLVGELGLEVHAPPGRASNQ